VIARRDRDHPALFFIFRQRKNLVGRAANLKRAGALQIFAFEEDLASGNSIKGSRAHDWRAVYASGDARGRFFDEFECQHGIRIKPQKSTKGTTQMNLPARLFSLFCAFCASLWPSNLIRDDLAQSSLNDRRMQKDVNRHE
jgi:hypothetical protein